MSKNGSCLKECVPKVEFDCSEKLVIFHHFIHFEKNGTKKIKASSTKKIEFSAKEWSNYNEQKKQIHSNFSITLMQKMVIISIIHII